MAGRHAADAGMTTMTATRAQLDSTRWHLQHGPIDLIIGADGEAAAVQAAHEACWQRFTGVLSELVAELPCLRRPVQHDAVRRPCEGSVASRMWDASFPHRARYITPMAAVAGSVADELIAAFERPGVSRAFINNGGDIALYLSDSQQYLIGVFTDLGRIDGARLGSGLPLDANLTLDAASLVRGIATSGWRGRSFSLGIADSVTVLARTAAAADAAATMIANAVDLKHADIVRQPASTLKDDSDLGDLLVTVDVPPLPQPLIDFALSRGAQEAARLHEQGLIEGAALFLQRSVRVVGTADRHASAPAARGGLRLTHDAHYPTEAPCSKYAAC
jgi:ApbE superfamily uncharacterized protein (UPF0280 family)